MTNRKSRERVKRPRRSSRRNGRSPSLAGPVSTPSGEQEARKPRILRARGVQGGRAEKAHLPPTRETSGLAEQIPERDLSRIRTWLKYGMTVRQAANVCSVSTSEIERVLQRA